MASIEERLSISKRSVRYDLDRVEAFLLSRQIPISKVRGSGIEIEAADPKRKEILAEFVNPSLDQIILSPNERFELLLFLILESTEPLSIKEVQTKLGVSRFTVLSDFEQVEVWLNAHDLEIIRRPGFGIQLEGKCSARCNAITSFLIDIVGVMPTLALCTDSKNMFLVYMQDNVHLTYAIQHFFSGLDIEYCASIYSSLQIFRNIKFTDKSYISLVINLAMQIARIKNGSKDIEIICDQEFEDAEMTQQIIDRVRQRYKISFSDAERNYLSALLNSAKYSRSFREITGEKSENQFNQETVDIANEMISLVSEYVHPYLKVDRELERSLLFHLDSMVRKLKIGLPFQNPVLDEVKKHYGYVFEVTRRACKILEDRINKPVSEEEIGFLAMHFAAAMERMRINTPVRKRVLVVCGEGVATAWLLVSRLKAELPNIEIVEVLSAHDLRKKDVISAHIDAIISTLPIEVRNTPLIVVNPFLQLDDVIAIKRVLGIASSVYQNNRNFVENTAAENRLISIKDLLKKKTIAVNMRVKDWKEVVDSAVGLLVNAGMAEPAFMQSIKNLISEHGPYMAIWPGIALLHGPPNGDVKQICLSLITLDPPISFGHPENDPVDIVFTLGTVNTLNHLQVLSEINTIVDSPEILAALRKATDENQILDILNNSIQ